MQATSTRASAARRFLGLALLLAVAACGAPETGHAPADPGTIPADLVGPGAVRARVKDLATRAPFEDVTLFDGVTPYADGDVDGVSFHFDRSLSARLKHRRPEQIRLTVPSADGVLRLQLYRVQLTTGTFAVATDQGDAALGDDGVHYRGVLEDDDDSLAAISVYDDGAAGFISTGTRIFNLAKQRGSDDHVTYAVDTLPTPEALGCQNDALGNVATPDVSRQSSAFVGDKYVAIYFEADFKMFQDHNSSVADTTQYVTSMFNQVATLYANENIELRVSSIFVWTTVDPYASLGNTVDVLTAFQASVGTSFQGNLAFFLTTRNLGGGVAYVDVVCTKSYAFGMGMIYNSFANVPTYSWTVEVVAHELGHNLGSPHTQACSWSGGALDNCAAPEGSCAPGPAPTNGGTVMSYCHLTSHGINFANGFGQQPGDLLRSRVLNGSCLATATPDTTAPTVTITSPADGTTYSSAQTITVSASADDEVGVARVEFLKDGVLVASDTTAPYSANVALNGANGVRELAATAFDSAGNSATASIIVTLSVPVDTTAPTTPANLTGSRKGRNAKLSWRPASDNVAVTGYLLSRNGVVVVQTTSTAATVGLVPGANTFTVAARDAAGNVSAPSNAVTINQ